MANATPHAHQIAPAQCALLVRAVRLGDVATLTAMLDADPLGYLKRDQMDALLEACDVTAPHAVALLDLFDVRRHTLFQRSYHFRLDYALARATEHADNCLKQYSARELESDLRWTTKTPNVLLVLCAASMTNDQLFVLRLMRLPAVQTSLASLEAAFEPCFIWRGRPYHYWLAQAMGRDMHAVVEMADDRYPLLTADTALVNEMCIPVMYADLVKRRKSLNLQIEAFHQAIQAGNVDVVGAMLEEVPALRRSTMDGNVYALMVSAMAPNAVALLQCLLDRSITNEAVVEALVYACQHGAPAASIAHLWNWIEALDSDAVRRDCALWKAISSATLHQHLAALRTLLPYVRDWKTSQLRDVLISAIDTNDDAFACALMELPVVEAYFKTLDDNGYGTIASIDVGSGMYWDDCDCSHEGACSEVAYCHVLIAKNWVRYALRGGKRRVADCLDKWWPALTREEAFLYFHRNLTDNAPMWSEMNQRYVRDVTWLHTRDAYLVQRRVLPALDLLGERIAKCLYVFDSRNEYTRWWHNQKK